MRYLEDQVSEQSNEWLSKVTETQGRKSDFHHWRSRCRA